MGGSTSSTIPPFDFQRWRRQFAVAHLKDLVRDWQNPQPGPDEVLAAMRAAPVAPLQGEPFGVGMGAHLEVDPGLVPRTRRRQVEAPDRSSDPANPGANDRRTEVMLFWCLWALLAGCGNCETRYVSSCEYERELADGPEFNICCNCTDEVGLAICTENSARDRVTCGSSSVQFDPTESTSASFGDFEISQEDIDAMKLLCTSTDTAD